MVQHKTRNRTSEPALEGLVFDCKVGFVHPARGCCAVALYQDAGLFWDITPFKAVAESNEGG
jgi:hypothetical protein